MSQRRRYSDEDKARWLGEFEQVGGSAAAFCMERGLAYQSFMQWRRAAGGVALETEQAQQSTGFVQIDLSPRSEPPGIGALVELDFGGALVLRIRPLHSHPSMRP
jgi:transposase-like protein